MRKEKRLNYGHISEKLVDLYFIYKRILQSEGNKNWELNLHIYRMFKI